MTDVLPEGFSVDTGVDRLPEGFTIDAPTDTPEQTETSPLEPPPSIETFMTLGVESLEPPEVVRKAASAGVLFDKPAPVGSALASFAFDDAEREKAFRMSLERRFGKDVPVRMGPATGVIEFFDEETGRFSLASPPGIDLGALAGPSVAMAPELVLGGTAAVLTKSPALVEFSAGLGAFMGEIMRVKIGQGQGINQDVTDATIIKQAMVVGGITVAAGVGLNNVVKLGKFVIDVADGRVATKAAVEGLELSAEDALRVQDDINRALATERFRLNLAQATNDEDLLAMQDFFKRSREFGKEFGEFADEQEAALRAYFESISRPYDSRLSRAEVGGGPNVVGERVQDALNSGLESEKRRLDAFVAMRESDLNQAVSSIQDTPLESLGRPVRELGGQEQEAFREWSREAVAELNKVAGNKEIIDNKNLFEVVQGLDAEISRALFPSVQEPGRRLIGDAVDSNKIFDPNARFTFLEAWDAISDLKRIERTASKGLSTDDPKVGAIKALYIALEKDLREGASGSPLRDQYDQFIFKYRAEKDRLDRGTVGKIMAREGKNGRFVVADEDVFRTVFQPGGKREADEFFALIGNDPQAMQGMRESIADFYKGEVIQDGRVDLKAHDDFFRKYFEPMKVFFTRDEIKQIAKPGNIENALRAREQAKKKALAEINKSFESRIASLDNPGRVVQLIMDPKNPDKARQLMFALQKTPDVRRAVQAEVRKEIAERTSGQFRGGERFFSAPKFNDFLNGKSGERGFSSVLESVFGKEYVDNLQTMNAALTLTSRETRFPNRSNTAFWIDTVKNLSRAYVGLFTRPGRVITALDRVRGRAANRVLVNAILNPKDLRALIQMRGVDLRTQKAAALIGSLGGTALLQDFE